MTSTTITITKEQLNRYMNDRSIVDVNIAKEQMTETMYSYIKNKAPLTELPSLALDTNNDVIKEVIKIEFES